MKRPPPASSAKSPGPRHPPDVQRLIKAIGGAHPPSFADLCDRLDLSPRRAGSLIDEARSLGVEVHVEHGHVGFVRNYGVQTSRVHRLHLPPLAGDTVEVAVISDTHFGSKYCLREALRDFIARAYDRGIRHVLHPGDLLEGMYRHAFGELSHAGLEDQTRDAFESLPAHPGLHYHAITGNHDETFAKSSGMNVGRYIEGYFHKNGRHDLHFYGDRGAYLEMYGTLIHLWHPLGGVPYAKSYKLQRQASSYQSGFKPHIVLAGHWHTFCHVEEREVQAIACPTFQSGVTPFGRSLGTTPSIGGLTLRWQMTEDRTLRNFALTRHPYYDHEVIQEAEGVR